MAWQVTATPYKGSINYDGKGSSRNLVEVFFDMPSADRRAKSLCLPDTVYNFVKIEEVYNLKCPHCKENA